MIWLYLLMFLIYLAAEYNAFEGERVYAVYGFIIFLVDLAFCWADAKGLVS